MQHQEGHRQWGGAPRWHGVIPAAACPQKGRSSAAAASAASPARQWRCISLRTRDQDSIVQASPRVPCCRTAAGCQGTAMLRKVHADESLLRTPAPAAHICCQFQRRRTDMQQNALSEAAQPTRCTQSLPTQKTLRSSASLSSPLSRSSCRRRRRRPELPPSPSSSDGGRRRSGRFFPETEPQRCSSGWKCWLLWGSASAAELLHCSATSWQLQCA